MVVGC